MNEEYKSYLKTAAWTRMRQLCLKQFGNRCGVCYLKQDSVWPSTGNKVRLTVHHRTYERCFNEDVMDLIPLCQKCNALFHADLNPMPVGGWPPLTEEEWKKVEQAHDEVFRLKAESMSDQEWDSFRNEWKEISRRFSKDGRPQ